METNKGDADLTRLVLFDPETGQEELVESDPMNRVDFGGAIYSEATDELVGTTYEDERARLYFRDKAWEADYKLLQAKFPGKDISLGSSTADDRIVLVTAASDTDPGERYLFDRDDQEADPAVQGARADPARAHGGDEGRALPVLGRARDPGLPHPAEGRPREGPPGDPGPARRPLGPRRLGLQQPRPVPRQPRLRGPAAQLPRLHRLRQEVPERRQQAVGREDAGRRHLGRQVPRRPGHRRPEARRDHGRLLRRLRDARRRRLHPRPLRGGGRRSSAPRTSSRCSSPSRPTGRPAGSSSTSAWATRRRRRARPSSRSSRRSTPRRRSRPRSSWPRAPTTRASRRPSRSRS